MLSPCSRLSISMVLPILATLGTTMPTHAVDTHYQTWAATPPMGWNSWDCFGTSVNEEQVKAQADAMARVLLPSGWRFLTVDIQWYEGESKGHAYKEGAPLTMDGMSRLMPSPKKFPSAADKNGFKPLADYIHAKGLLFGIHIMRGIPRQAVHANAPVANGTATAAEIAIPSSTCSWNPDMYGVNMELPAGQAYYDSLFKLYASWGVDLVKVDDIARPYDAVQAAEIEGIRRAIDACGRPIILSLSPGDTPIQRGTHVASHANMWRISDDFWDKWEPLHGMFGRLDRWSTFRKPGAWPDADMLPFGIIEFSRPTRFTQDEQRLCMTLWSIAKSPLILGADMTRLDGFTVGLLTNKEILDVNQHSTNNRQLSNANDLIIWSADDPIGKDRYVAFFNAQSNDSVSELMKSAVYASPVITTMNGSVDISVPIANAKKLLLLVGDGNDNFVNDHAAWIGARLIGPKGSLSVSDDLKWRTAKAGWGEVCIDRTCENLPLAIQGSEAKGIGTHAPSMIEYDLPDGYTTFEAKGVLLRNGSVQFAVSTYDRATTPSSRTMTLALSDVGMTGGCKVRDMWLNKDVGVVHDRLNCDVPFHGAKLFRLSPTE